MVNSWLESIHDRLFPAACRLCRAPARDGLDLCRDCLDDLPWLPPGCPRCALPLDAGAGTPCGACSTRPPAYDGCIALFSYEFPVDHLVQQIKFGADLALARSLGILLLRRLRECGPPAPDRVVPVPLHPSRLSERGFNQARELARPLRAAGLRLDDRLCRRIRRTPAQAGLPADQRRRNLRGSFEVRGPVAGGHLLLVDDVMTTGATLEELARTLKRAGAARVEALVIARTLRR
ncbi:MAG TPA: ComF family protein [Gammaproteobacteria bacterium]|nr:ComF family protein [Gammaproteobacteria bacterium]